MSGILWAGVIGILVACVTAAASGQLHRHRKPRPVTPPPALAGEPCPWCTRPECGAGPEACTCREHRQLCEGITWCASWWPGNPVPIEWERSDR